MLKKRYLTPFVIEDLEEKMVFISGPRQVGKTTLSRELVAVHIDHCVYYNWDYKEDRKQILGSKWPSDAKLIILDEIHKYRRWKTLIKGNYDKWKKEYKFLVTGSGNLNTYRKGGDSLQGRYHHFRLHPFTVAEYASIVVEAPKPFLELTISHSCSEDDFNALFHFGGFPEPLIKHDARHLRRWHREKIERLFREDIRDIEAIRDLGTMQVLADLLPEKVGSPLSINSIREDLEVSHKAVSHWMAVLESFYYHFRIYPFASRKIRSLKKEPKLFLWDWSEIKDEGARFENMIASHLLKFVHFLHDYSGYKAELYYLRDRDKREVDFLVTIDGKPWFACEAKLSDSAISSHLNYFNEKLAIPFCYQIYKEGREDYRKGNIRVLSAAGFLPCLF
ncbi:MAG: ATP-binding protein [Waddliaceae bacterium]